jgi:hypothetical protein
MLLTTLMTLTGCQPSPSGEADSTSFIIFIACIPIIIFIMIAFVRSFSLQKKIGGQTSGSTTKTPKASHSSIPDTSDLTVNQLPTSSRVAIKPSETEEEFAPQAIPARIFVSYRRSDSADVSGRIYDRLIAKFGKETVFKDVDSIPLGLDFKEYLDKQVGECNVFLAVIGDRWLDAKDTSGKSRLDDPVDFVRIEIESALARGIPVIPLLVRDAKMPSEEQLPATLKKLVYRNGTPIRSDPDFHRDMDRLISALEKYVK